jgi:hypothetical protein
MVIAANFRSSLRHYIVGLTIHEERRFGIVFTTLLDWRLPAHSEVFSTGKAWCRIGLASKPGSKRSRITATIALA